MSLSPLEGGHPEDTPRSYLHRLRSARTAAPAAGGGDAAARRTRPCPGPADPPSPRSAKPRASICPRSVPDHDYRSVISARQLGSRSASRALLIRSRLSIQMETSQEVPTDQKKKSSTPPPAVLLLYSSIHSLFLLPLPAGERGAAASEAGTGAPRGGLLGTDVSAGPLEDGRTNTQSHAHSSTSLQCVSVPVASVLPVLPVRRCFPVGVKRKVETKAAGVKFQRWTRPVRC